VRNQDEVLFSILTYCKLIFYYIVNNKQQINLQTIEELVKLVIWEDVTLDGLLEFILNESKLLLNSNFLQEILIGEFRRRFKDEFGNTTHENQGN
jgi:hypothetical protein